MAELGQTDDSLALVPGSWDEIDAVMAMCRHRADLAGEAADTVVRGKSIDDWTGAAAEAYAVRATQVAKAWTDAQDALSRVAAAMRAYRSALFQAQQRATMAVMVWDYGEVLQRHERAAPLPAPFTQRSAPTPPVFTAGFDRVSPRTSAEAFAKATIWLSEARAWVSDAARVAVLEVNAATELLHVEDGSMWATAGAALATGPATPTTTLSVLKSLQGPDLASLLATRPDLVRLLSRAAPEDIAVWWPNLDRDQQDALIHAIPAVIGNLGGVAYRARDEANRLVLAQAIDDARKQPCDNPDQLAALEALERSSSGYTLASLVLDVPPLAQVAVGDLDAAATVSFIVPGMNSTVEGDMQTYVSAAQKLQAQQRAVGGGQMSDYAVVAWLGYHPPMSTAPADVAFNGKAEAGASALAGDLTSMAAVRAATGAPASISVVAHSYGTNVTALALTHAHADHVVLLGSAGIDNRVDNVADMNVPPGQVFASQADHDGWAPIGQLTSRVVGDARIDPTDISFGAQNFSSEAASTPSGELLHAVDKHGPLGDGSTSFSYLDSNTTAQYNTALATVGRDEDFLVESPSSFLDGFKPFFSREGNGIA